MFICITLRRHSLAEAALQYSSIQFEGEVDVRCINFNSVSRNWINHLIHCMVVNLDNELNQLCTDVCKECQTSKKELKTLQKIIQTLPLFQA